MAREVKLELVRYITIVYEGPYIFEELMKNSKLMVWPEDLALNPDMKEMGLD